MNVRTTLLRLLHFAGIVVVPKIDRDNWLKKDNAVNGKTKRYKVRKDKDSILMSDGKYYVRDFDPECSEYILDSTKKSSGQSISPDFLFGLDDVLIKEHNLEQDNKPANQRIKLKEANYKALKPVFARGASYKGKSWIESGGEAAIDGLKGVSERSRAEYWKVFRKSQEIEISTLSSSN